MKDIFVTADAVFRRKVEKMMKKCGVFLLAVMLMMPAASFAADHPWKLKKDEDGIQVHVRKIDGSSILEYKGTVVVDASLDQVVRLFEEDGRIPEWFHKCSEAKLIKASTPEDKILYFVISMPWPVKDRDVVFRRVRSKDLATGIVEYKSSALPEDYPKQGGRIRMPYLQAIWRLTPLEGGRTELYYQQHSEVGGHIPAWLVNKLAVNIPFDSLFNFRRLLKAADQEAIAGDGKTGQGA